MTMSASFFTDIGFATKLNYQAYAEKYPREAAQLQALIDQHYAAMKKDCSAFVHKHRTQIYLVEEQRKEEARRTKIKAEQAKLEMQKAQWAKEVSKHEKSISPKSLAGLTQLTPIDLSTPAKPDEEVNETTMVDDLANQMHAMKVGYEEQIKELKGYVLFLESKCKELGEKNFELEKENFLLNELTSQLKTQLNSEIIQTGEKRKRQ